MLLVGGGSGVVPLMAMLRHRRRTMPELPMRLVYSVRIAEEVIYADELGDETTVTYTRERARRLDRAHRAASTPTLLAGPAEPGALAFVCGSNGFVEAATALLLDAGFDPDRIRTERFGPTG